VQLCRLNIVNKAPCWWICKVSEMQGSKVAGCGTCDHLPRYFLYLLETARTEREGMLVSCTIKQSRATRELHSQA